MQAGITNIYTCRPVQNSVCFLLFCRGSDDFKHINDSPGWKRHTVVGNDSGYNTTDSNEKCNWSPMEVSQALPVRGCFLLVNSRKGFTFSFIFAVTADLNLLGWCMCVVNR